jgi:hypothetical protein
MTVSFFFSNWATRLAIRYHWTLWPERCVAVLHSLHRTFRTFDRRVCLALLKTGQYEDHRIACEFADPLKSRISY